MAVRIDVNEGGITAYIAGEIDHHAAKGIREEIDTAAERNSPGLLILDFKGVTFMDSSGIGLVMGRYKLMQALGGDLLVTNVPSHIRKVMRLAGLDRLSVIDNGGKRA